MFVAFMLLHILLYDEVPRVFCFACRSRSYFKFEFGSKWFKFIRDFENRKLTLSGLRGKSVNPANPVRA
jgi:hypothetical protein